MSYSHTFSDTTTFTVTHARHLASKVATDLKRVQRFYGNPADSIIASYEEEAIELLKAGYLGAVAYGFKRNGYWIEPTLQYTAHEFAGIAANNDDPGKVRPGANTNGAGFSSFLTYSPAWYRLSRLEQEAFESHLPFRRTAGEEPGVLGYFSSDLTYSAGGRSLNRASVRSYG
uniref:Bacterial HORMA domain-containing protein n=1 Tax=Candidatus Kentrum sp. FW TaxID=2126338 RepID=A0A450TYP4_9GAMM|nr:MAG: hypothetical protein BECKFW1821C_GA0114237_10678 [Candidatus Kentron sp. FW]